MEASLFTSFLLACFYRPLDGKYIKQAGGVMLVWSQKRDDEWELLFLIENQQGEPTIWSSMVVNVVEIEKPQHIYMIEAEQLSRANCPGRWKHMENVLLAPGWQVESILG